MGFDTGILGYHRGAYVTPSNTGSKVIGVIYHDVVFKSVFTISPY